MSYICMGCKKRVELDSANAPVSCPNCSGKILVKERPPVVKKVKAR